LNFTKFTKCQRYFQNTQKISVHEREKIHLSQIIADEYANRRRESAKEISVNQREKIFHKNF